MPGSSSKATPSIRRGTLFETEPHPGTAGWSEKQEALAALSTDSVHLVIEGTDHGSMIEEGKDAAATTRAILDVVSSIRTATPLTGSEKLDARSSGGEHSHLNFVDSNFRKPLQRRRNLFG